MISVSQDDFVAGCLNAWFKGGAQGVDFTKTDLNHEAIAKNIVGIALAAWDQIVSECATAGVPNPPTRIRRPVPTPSQGSGG